jgi:tetratricopeptide (TPR) repeat protein
VLAYWKLFQSTFTLAGAFLLTAVTYAAAQTQPQESESRRAMDLNESGMRAAENRNYAEAERDYRASSQLYRSLGAPFEAHLSIVLFNLAESICGEGRWRESQSAFEESLTLAHRALGPAHIRTIAGLNALGHVKLMLADFDGAEALFTEALAAARQLKKPDTQLAYALAGFSSLRLRANKPEEALPFADEALRVTIESEPAESLETATMYANVGRIHRAAGRPERALPLLRKARAIYEKTRASADPRYASVLSEEGLAFMDEGKFATANAGMKSAIALLEKCSGCGFELAIARNNLGLLRFQQKKYVEADDLLRKALEAEERYSPVDAAQIGRTKSALEQVRSALR